MSAYISGAVWISGPKQQTRRFVLLAIADNANDEGFAWPSVQAIAEKCLMTTRTVISCLADLQAEGWLCVNRKAVEGKGNSYQIVLEKLHFQRPKSRERVSPEKTTQVKLTTDSGETDDIAIRKNHQEPSLFSPDGVELVDKKEKKKRTVDLKFGECRKLLDEFYAAVNDGKKCPWGGAEGFQLSKLLKEVPDLTVKEFDVCLENYSKSESINLAKRPSTFLHRLVEFRDCPLNKFGRPLEQ